MPVEIRDPLHGTIELTSGETEVIDSAEFQRLRAIKQLGFADISFPGATHTRFLHSIGVCHLAGRVFDHIFEGYSFSHANVKKRLRQCFRLAALLHDIGHGPLSHTTEEVMPRVEELNIKLYSTHRTHKQNPKERATHEDYTIKYLMDSPLEKTLRTEFSNLSNIHIACLIDKTLVSKDDFFIDQGVDFRPLLSQLVSSELDVDRMDYLERDSYYTGTNYGKIDLDWMIKNLTYYIQDGKAYLALNRRALYTFDDFLISRHHIHLMVYFHHKAIIYEEMLNNYLTSKECAFYLPADIEKYTKYNDYKLYEHLADSKNEWAQRISKRKPYKVLIEQHNTLESTKPQKIKKALENNGFSIILSSSKARLSKYHATSEEDKAYQIYVVDNYDKWAKAMPIGQSTEIFDKYEEARIIDRLYVAPEQYSEAKKFLDKNKI